MWTAFELRLALNSIGANEPSFAWQGVQKISTWIFGLPVAAVLITSGIGSAVLGGFIAAEGYAVRRSPPARPTVLPEEALREIARLLGQEPLDDGHAHPDHDNEGRRRRRTPRH